MISLFDTSASVVAAAAASSTGTDLLVRFDVLSAPPLAEPAHYAVKVVTSTMSNMIATSSVVTLMISIRCVCPENSLYGGEEATLLCTHGRRRACTMILQSR